MADTTPAPAAPAASTPFWQYLKDNVPNHLKVIAIILGITAAVIGVNYIRDLKQELVNQQKVTATLSQKFQAVGSGAVTGNSQATQAQVTAQATDVFGAQIVALMSGQNAKINSLTSAIGMTNMQVAALATPKQPTTFTALQQSAQPQSALTYGLTGYPLEQTRPNGPALSSVNLFYDPTQTNTGKAFAGTTWTSYQEQFTTSVGDWERQKDGGFRTTVKLSRTVSKPDPNNPGKTLQVGTEIIPLTSADTVYTPKGLLDGAIQPDPRWTLGLGVGSNKVGSYTPAAEIGYRVLGNNGVFAGTANNGAYGGITIRLGSKKQ